MTTQHSDGVAVTVQFKQRYDVKPDTAVELNGLVVGAVKAVDTADQGTRVTLSLDADKVGVVQQNAAVAFNAMRDRMLIYNSVNASESVVPGHDLQSLNSPLEEAAWQAGRAIGLVQESVRNAANSFNSYFQSDEWHQTKQRVEDDLSAFAEQSRQAADAVSQDVKKFMADLESESKGAVDNAQEQFKSLEQQMRQFSQTGQDDVTQRMERLMQSLRNALEGRNKNG